MDSAKELSIDFLRSHPRGATSVLESIDAKDAAAFLKYVSDEIAARSLEIMQPVVAATVISGLPVEKASTVLPLLDVHSRTAILRIVGDDTTKTIMSKMPSRVARDLTRSLHYPAGSAGAWMSSDMAVFEKSTPIGQCLDEMRALPEKVSNTVFVVDGKRKFFGAIDLAGMLAASDDSPIGSPASSGVRRLSPYAQLSSIVGLAEWDKALSLPVVDNKGRLLGALHFDRLREGYYPARPVIPE